MGLAISCLAASLVGVVVLAVPPRVDHVTIVNPTDYRLFIFAGAPDDRGLTQVGIIGPDTTKTFDDVIDRGVVWVLDVQVQGAHAGGVEVRRDELTGATPYTIPFDIDQRLKDAGIATDIAAEP
jgi:hypothetical protein